MRPWLLSGPSLPTPHSWAPLRLGHLKEVGQLAARHFNDANNARRDLGHAHAAWVASGEEDLDGLGAGHLLVTQHSDPTRLEVLWTFSFQ